MAECKDCIHFCVCSPYTAPSERYPEVGGCPAFKNSAEFVCVVHEPKVVEIDQFNKWIPASIPPTEYRDEYGELIPFLVCEEGTEYPFRAMYDGKIWGDGFFKLDVTHWMPLPQPPKGE